MLHTPGYSGTRSQTPPIFHFGSASIARPISNSQPSREWIKGTPEKNLDITTLSPTSLRVIKKDRLTYSGQSDVFNKDGVHTDTLLKGTPISLDTTKPIYSRRNPITGKLEAYLAIESYTHTKNGKHAETSARGYIRASWLDSRIADTKPSDKAEKNPSKKIGFDGYFGPDGKIVPPYLLKAVTVHYIKKDIFPKLEGTLHTLQSTINQTRSAIVNEVMTKGVPMKETFGYRAQLANIEKQGQVKNFYASLQNFTLNGSTVISDPSVEQVLSSIQKTPKWQSIIAQAAHIDYQKRAGKI